MNIPNINDDNLVLVVQEFGFNHWFWNPPFALEQLEKFWSKLPHIDSSSITATLGGTLLCIEKISDDRDFENYYNYFQEINKEGIPYIHFCDNINSYLILKNGQPIFHQGAILSKD